MNRDLELIRALLLDLEGDSQVDLSAYTAEQIRYHQALLVEGKLVDGRVHYPGTRRADIPDKVSLNRLTWEGHEFLDKARSESTWRKAKEILAKQGLSLSFEAIKVALSQAIKSLLGPHDVG